MIQVLQRMDQIFTILGYGKPMQLRDLAESVDLKKTTLSNIVKTLVHLGYLRQTANGSYTLGARIYDIARPGLQQETLVSLADEHVRQFAQKTKEAGVLALYDKGDVVMVSKAVYEQSVTVNFNAIRNFSPYGTALGRLLISYLPDAQFERFVGEHGIPGDEWEEVNSRDELDAMRAEIREEGIAFKIAPDRQLAAMAVPIFGNGGTVWAAFGLFLPQSRFQGKRKEVLIADLREAAERLTTTLNTEQQ